MCRTLVEAAGTRSVGVIPIVGPDVIAVQAHTRF
jgi:hypothetical protein